MLPEEISNKTFCLLVVIVILLTFTMAWFTNSPENQNDIIEEDLELQILNKKTP